MEQSHEWSTFGLTKGQRSGREKHRWTDGDRTTRESLAVPSGMAAARVGEGAALDLTGQNHEGGPSSFVKEVAGHEPEANVPMKWQGPGPSSNISQEECVGRRKRVARTKRWLHEFRRPVDRCQAKLVAVCPLTMRRGTFCSAIEDPKANVEPNQVTSSGPIGLQTPITKSFARCHSSGASLDIAAFCSDHSFQAF